MPYPFDYVSKGLELFDVGRFSDAEKSILKGIKEYEKAQDKRGVAYALGRLGFCYEKAGFEEKAKETYEKAVNLGTDIPVTHESLISILTFQGEIDRAFKVADIYQLNCCRNLQQPAHELFIRLSSRLIREDKKEEAVSLLQRTLAHLPIEKYPSYFWQVRGLIGFALEKSGNLEDAMNIYRQAIDEGSADSKTFQHYLINLEKLKDFTAAIIITEKGLKVQKDVAWEADLKKRLQRLKIKTGEISKISPKQVIEDYSIKKGAKNISLVQQIHFSPQLSFLIIHDNFFYGVTGGKAPKLCCYRVETQECVWEKAIERQPAGLLVANDRLITFTREGPISRSHTKLHFFTLEANLIAVQQLPDISSHISACGGRIYAGCRDGKLYAFSTEGAPLWIYGLKDTRDDKDDKYSRPYPYYVSAGKEIVAFSNYETMYVLNTNGKLLYQWNVPDLNENMIVDDLSEAFSMEGGPISSLEVVPDSRKVLVSYMYNIFEVTDGKVTIVTNTSPEIICHIQVLENKLIGACGFEHALIVSNGKVQKKIFVGGFCDITSNLSANRLAVWSGNMLKILTYSGVILSEIEFVKTIHNVHIFNSGLILVATRYAILFDTTLRETTSQFDLSGEQTSEVASE